jgi:hypothetical protein
MPPAARWRRFIGPAVILVAATLASAPLVLHHPLCGDDLEFHFASWLDAQQSWRQGIPYPHWASSANYGAGEPRFVFYPPLTWMLGAALGLVLPWALVPFALTFLLLAATGLATRALAHQALADAPATLAGCAALFSGHALYTAYERTAFGELAGGFWIPLLLLFALRDRNPSASLWHRALNGSTLPLALVMAGTWLSDAPVGVMASYLLAAVALAAALLARSWAPVVRASIGSAMGIALPALYLIPAAWEQRWVNISVAINDPILTIENSWLFARHSDPSLQLHDAELHVVSLMAASMIAVALVSMLVFWQRCKFSAEGRFQYGQPLFRRWWVPLALIPAVVLFLQLPPSLPVWNLLPKLRFLQFPSRWLLVLEAPMAIFFTAAVWPGNSARRRQRGAVAVLCALFFLAATVFAERSFFRDCHQDAALPDLLATYRSGAGFVGTDEYAPPGADNGLVPIGIPMACLIGAPDTELGIDATPGANPAWQAEQGSCGATAITEIRQSEHIRIAGVTGHAGYLVLHLRSYPAWRVTVNGRLIANLPRREDELMAVPVPQGPVDLTVDWTTTPDVVIGRRVSVLAILLLTALCLLEQKLSRPRLS